MHWLGSQPFAGAITAAIAALRSRGFDGAAVAALGPARWAALGVDDLTSVQLATAIDRRRKADAASAAAAGRGAATAPTAASPTVVNHYTTRSAARRRAT